MSQDLGATPTSPLSPQNPPNPQHPTSDADALAAARTVQQLLHGYAHPNLNEADLPTLSDIPVLPAAPAPAQAAPAATSPPTPRHRAVCTCCNGSWDTEVDLRRHPEQMLLCPRCEAAIHTQTEGLDDIERPLPQAMAAAMALAPGATHGHAVPLDSVPPIARGQAATPTAQPPQSPQASPAAPVEAAAALQLDTMADAPEDEPDAGLLPSHAGSAARRGPSPLAWGLGGLGALLLLALGAVAGYAWNDLNPPPQTAAAARPTARPMAQANSATTTATPTTSTSTSGTTRATGTAAARQPAPPAAPPRREPTPSGCPAGVAAMGLCNAS